MRFLRLTWRGVRDLFDQFLSLCLFSLLWWVCLVLIVPGPPATVALFAMADPRRQISTPEFGDAVAVFRSAFGRSWGIALCTGPLLLILLWNLFFFAGTQAVLAALVPLWIIMIVLLTVTALYAFSVAATMESGVRNAFRGAMYVLVSRPFTGIFLSLFLIVLFMVLLVMVLPAILFGPALIASIVNRFVLHGLNVEVIDPNSPTDERAYERERGINPDRGILSRLRGDRQHRA